MSKKLTNKSRKATLLRVLSGVGELPGIDSHRTPGEDCAIAIAIALIEATDIDVLDRVAKGKKWASTFWEKQW